MYTCTCKYTMNASALLATGSPLMPCPSMLVSPSASSALWRQRSHKAGSSGGFDGKHEGVPPGALRGQPQLHPCGPGGGLEQRAGRRRVQVTRLTFGRASPDPTAKEGRQNSVETQRSCRPRFEFSERGNPRVWGGSPLHAVWAFSSRGTRLGRQRRRCVGRAVGAERRHRAVGAIDIAARTKYRHSRIPHYLPFWTQRGLRTRFVGRPRGSSEETPGNRSTSPDARCRESCLSRRLPFLLPVLLSRA